VRTARLGRCEGAVAERLGLTQRGSRRLCRRRRLGIWTCSPRIHSRPLINEQLEHHESRLAEVLDLRGVGVAAGGLDRGLPRQRRGRRSRTRRRSRPRCPSAPRRPRRQARRPRRAGEPRRHALPVGPSDPRATRRRRGRRPQPRRRRRARALRDGDRRADAGTARDDHRARLAVVVLVTERAGGSSPCPPRHPRGTRRTRHPRRCRCRP